MSELSIDHEFRGDFLIVRLAGRLRPHDAEDFDIEINRIALAEARTIVLDMESLDFIGSSGIGALVRLAKAMDKHEIRTRVAAARPEIETLFRQARLDGMFPLFETVDDALA